MSTSDVERRLRVLEQRTLHLARRAESAADAIGAAYQDLILARMVAQAPGGPCHITVYFAVQAGCGTQLFGLVGATVEIRRHADQALLASGMTAADGSILLAFDDPVASGGGNYDIQSRKGPRWAPSAQQNFNANCGDVISGLIGDTLQPAAGYVCCDNCAEPIPTTLHGTGPDGAFTATWNATYGAWLACYTKVEAGHAWNGVNACQAAQVSVAIDFHLTCAGGDGKFRLTEHWSACQAGTTGAAGTCSGGLATFAGPGGRMVNSAGPFLSSAVAPNCTPVSLSFVVVGANVNGTISYTE
jgi:hypothetical protein